jgi:spermidine/putrescine transport system permease protein
MRWLRKNIIGIVAILVLVYLFIPIAVIMVLSFNNPEGK